MNTHAHFRGKVALTALLFLAAAAPLSVFTPAARAESAASAVAAPLTEEQAYKIALEGYHYFPLISMEITRRVSTNLPEGVRNPPQITDWSITARLARLGIRAGGKLEFSAAPEPVRRGMERAATDGLAQMKAKLPTLARVVNGWQMNTDTMGVNGNVYLKRAIVAMVGLGANQPEDAIYPTCVADAEGKPVKGEHRYVMRFKRDELPPVSAFWSITMYDQEGFQVANPINRFAIGDRDAL